MATSFLSSSSQFTLIIIFFVSSSLSSSAATETQQLPFKKIYAFGDSFTDTGNTESHTGPSGFSHVSNLPYGSTFFHHPTNRYSDGRLVIDFVAQSLSLPFLPPYRYLKGNESSGVNFAVAGSTAIDYEFFVKNNLSIDVTPQSIRTQLSWFNKFLDGQGCKGAAVAASDTECQAAFEDALFWVGEIGVNDYAYILGSSVSGDTIQQLAMESFTGFLQALLKKGAKYMVVQGLPPSGCLTLAMTLAAEDDRDGIGCVKSASNQTYSHNAILQAKLQDLRKQFPHSVIVYADYWNAYRTVVKNPGKYGFKETFKACCGSGEPYNFNLFETCGSPSVRSCSNTSQYINWDGVHLTEAMYKVVSDLFLHGRFSHPPFSYLLGRKQQQG